MVVMARISNKILPRFLLISFLTVILLIVSIRVSFPRMLSGFLPDVPTDSDAATLKASDAHAAAAKAAHEAAAAASDQYEAARRADRAADAAALAAEKARMEASSAQYLAERRKNPLSTSHILGIIALVLILIVFPIVFFVRKWRSEQGLN
jgi:hypothetical protein